MYICICKYVGKAFHQENVETFDFSFQLFFSSNSQIEIEFCVFESILFYNIYNNIVFVV